MPSRIDALHTTIKHCVVCGERLKLKVVRDIERKQFCSNRCKGLGTVRATIDALPERTCRCGVVFKPANASHRVCTAQCYTLGQVERSYRYMNGNPRAYILHLIAKPGRRHLKIDDMMAILERQQGRCALSGVELTFVKRTDGVKQHTNLSIDRRDSSRGYELDNIQLVCAIVNIMKSSLTVDQLRWWCGQIIGQGE